MSKTSSQSSYLNEKEKEIIQIFGTFSQNYDNQNQRPTYQPKQLNSFKKKLFEDYISKEEAEKSIEVGSCFKGTLRINPKNYNECFLDNPKGTEHHDVLCLKNDRNRALQGDVVVVKFNPKEEWMINGPEYIKWWSNNKPGTIDHKFKKGDNTSNKTLKNEIQESNLSIDEIPETCLIMTGSVVRIDKMTHQRVAAGKLQIMNARNSHALFIPTDSRIPRIMIPRSDIDPEFFNRPKDFEKFVYTAKLTDWRSDSIFADGRIVKFLGESGQIETETEAIIFGNDIDNREFSEECLASLPIQSEDEWKIPETELSTRRDFRNDLVFTIDPKTARDLDDALSIDHIDDCDGKKTPGFKIGVHIADVTYFVNDKTELDRFAQNRGNSTYLAQMVIPMLPRILCEQLCSLNPGVDRLAFSVVFKMTYEAEIKDIWFGRSIIRSRVKLAYEHAQDFIENPDKDFQTDELPEIFDGHTPAEIKEKVLMLHRIAKILRAKREENGALRIEQPKLKFSINQETKEPMGVSVYEIKEANKLVEEFMLLTNMKVAEKIERHFPEHALLRNHPPPKENMMKKVIEQCAKIGFPLDGMSSKCLSTTLKKFQGNSKLHTCIRQVISLLTIKPMQQARYFCVKMAQSQENYCHYALNVSRYTHFTSPIRRYPDMIVHRQLAAALGYCEPIDRTPEEIEEIASKCNDTKLASKNASDQSADLYFGFLVHTVKKINSRAVVVSVLDKAFDVLIIDYGILKRVYCDKLQAEVVSFDENEETLILRWAEDPNAETGNKQQFMTTIRMCTVIDVEIYPLKDIDYGVVMLRPTLAQRMFSEKTLKTMFDEETNFLDC